MTNILKSCAVALAISALPSETYAEAPSHEEETLPHQWGEIDTQGLEALLKAKTPIALVDARSDKWFDGTLIQGAQRLPAETAKREIEKILPNKNQLIVVYCAGEGCPASKNLAKRLLELGYKNIIDYHDGIQVWKAQNKPIEKV